MSPGLDFSVPAYPITRLQADRMLRSVSFDEDAVSTLESNEHIKAVELDKEVKTQ